MSFTVCRTIVVLRVDGEAELLKKKLADLRAACGGGEAELQCVAAARRSCSMGGAWRRGGGAAVRGCGEEELQLGRRVAIILNIKSTLAKLHNGCSKNDFLLRFKCNKNNIGI
jgi:hypothetical protein